MSLPEQSAYRRSMAEEIRRRVAALRLAALLAVALTVAGITTRGPVTTLDASRVAGVPADSVGSRQVIDNSLRLKDFKIGQVLSPDRAASLYVKIDFAEKTYLHKDDAAATYLHKESTAVDAHKLGGIPASGYLQGDGSVHTGLVQLAEESSDQLLEVPGMLSVLASASKNGTSATLTNKSGEVLWFSWGTQTTSVQPGGTAGILIGLNQPTLVQVVGLSGAVSTLTLTAAGIGGSTLFTGQALVGDG